jgi:TPR repeat protein
VGQNAQGGFLEFGSVVSQTIDQAAHHYKLSTDQGNSAGQFNYGRCLETGSGLPPNAEEYVKYHKPASKSAAALPATSTKPRNITDCLRNMAMQWANSRAASPSKSGAALRAIAKKR